MKACEGLLRTCAPAKMLPALLEAARDRRKQPLRTLALSLLAEVVLARGARELERSAETLDALFAELLIGEAATDGALGLVVCAAFAAFASVWPAKAAAIARMCTAPARRALAIR
ncbi:hypothetical protein T492DRAFT_1142371 [Pavlovales sp. CCMP2436]|nr:hypothetical protein T492DRAFT_1142371 [Pavlovales sp. CCMP2436]